MSLNLHQKPPGERLAGDELLDERGAAGAEIHLDPAEPIDNGAIAPGQGDKGV